MAADGDGYGQTEWMGEEYTSEDIRTGGRTRNMENKNQSGTAEAM